ncbi:MAG: mandelate racemase/muconate lactonizing enzyme family protein [Alphaproteobacteria bacterium]
MKIKDVKASIHTMDVEIPLAGKIQGYGRAEQRHFVLAQVETDQGLTGVGLTGHFLAPAVVAALQGHVAEVVRDMDPRDLEAIHARVHDKLNPRAMTGAVSMALSCLDMALWDIIGKHQGRTVAGLLGGARAEVPVYCTFGFPHYDRDLLAEAAKLQVANGFTALKMVVAVDSGGWREDVRRIRAVREAVGPDIDLMIDANYLFTPLEAKLLARAVKDVELTWFEEPLSRNDAGALAQLRQAIDIPLAAGQMEGHIWRLREHVERQAVDILQPNVCYCGGFTVARKAAHLAEAYNLPIANGGGWPHFNMHLMAGMENGWMVEWHLGMTSVAETLFKENPRPTGGVLSIPDAPGLGLTLDADAVKDTRVD